MNKYKKLLLILFGIIILCIICILAIIFKNSGKYILNLKINNDPITSVQDSITEYQNGLKNIPDPWLFPLDKSYIKILHDKSSLITTYSQLVAYSFLNPPQQSLAYKGLSPWLGLPESNFCLDFEQTNVGWYFMYGSTKSYRFTLMIFHIGLNGQNPKRTLFSIVGGCDTGKGWIPIPQNGGTAEYTCDKQQNITFDYDNKNKKIKVKFNRKLNKITGFFSYNNSDYIQLTFELISKQKATYNGPNGGCVPKCFGGMGTLYWSYTNPICNITNGQKLENSGIGWFDHQNKNVGIPHGTLNQILYSFIIGGTIPISTSWLWLTLQLEDRQYMGYIMGIEDKLPLKKEMEFPIKLNKYTKDGVKYSISCSVKIKNITSVSVDNKYKMVFPITYEFTIPNEDKLFLKSDAQNNKPDVVIMPSGNFNWEGTGSVYDSNLKNMGKGFLEGNNLLPNKLLNKIRIHTAFPDTIVDNQVVNIPEQKPLSNIGKFIGIALIILLLIILICTIIIVINLFNHSKKIIP